MSSAESSASERTPQTSFFEVMAFSNRSASTPMTTFENIWMKRR